MTLKTLSSSAGFTYIGAIVMVVIMGIMLSQGAQYWSTRMKQEREVELLYRGAQVRDAIRRWYNWKPPVAGQAPPPAVQRQTRDLTDLKALVNDPNLAAKVHLLRPTNMIDPITGEEWKKITVGLKIIGVCSASEAAPLKQDNFPWDLDPADFKEKKKYSEWQFIYDHYPKPGATGGGVTGLGGSTHPATPPAPN